MVLEGVLNPSNQAPNCHSNNFESQYWLFPHLYLILPDAGLTPPFQTHLLYKLPAAETWFQAALGEPH